MKKDFESASISSPLIKWAKIRDLGLVPFSKPYVDALERAGSFPRRVQFGPRSVYWRLDEVVAWREERERTPVTTGIRRRADDPWPTSAEKRAQKTTISK